MFVVTCVFPVFCFKASNVLVLICTACFYGIFNWCVSARSGSPHLRHAGQIPAVLSVSNPLRLNEILKY